MAGGRCAGDYLPYLKHTEPVPVAGLSRRHPDFCVYRFASVFVAERETFTADDGCCFYVNWRLPTGVLQWIVMLRGRGV